MHSSFNGPFQSRLRQGGSERAPISNCEDTNTRTTDAKARYASVGWLMAETELFPRWASSSERHELNLKLNACEKVSEVASLMKGRQPSSTSSRDGRTLPGAAFEEFARTKNSFDACILLAATGHGPPAEVLAGVVLLSGLQVVWALQQDPEVVDRRADLHARLLGQLDLQGRRENGLWKRLPQDNLLEGQDFVDAVNLFGPDGLGSWTGHATHNALIDDLIAIEPEEFGKRQLDGLRIMLARSRSFQDGSGTANQAYRTSVTAPDGSLSVSMA